VGEVKLKMGWYEEKESERERERERGREEDCGMFGRI